MGIVSRLVFIVAAFCLPASFNAAIAQDGISVGILRFQKSDNTPDSIATAIEQMVYSKFADRKRFKVIERSQLDAIHAELAAQDIMGVEQKTALESLGASYVVIGQVTQAAVTRSPGSQGASYYSANISYGIRIVDVKTGAVAYSESFSNGRGNPFANVLSGFTGDTSTPAGAVDIAVQQTAKQVDSFLNSSFPIQGRLVSVESRGRKGLPENVLITLGSADGVGKKSKAIVYVQETLSIDGKSLIRKKPLAELSFLRSEGEQLSVFKITKSQGSIDDHAGSNAVFVELLP